jgi:phosphoglycerate kinase
VRFEPGETRNDEALARQYAQLADLYVDDAFGSAHRAHASTEGVAHLLPSAAGRLLAREVGTLRKILEDPRRPLVAVIGGAKVTDKIGVIERCLQLADAILIGGAMCFPFLSALGHDVGGSLCEPEGIEPARAALDAAARGARARLELPSDLVIATSLSDDAPARALDGVDVPEGWMGLDIGPATAARYADEVARAGTVFWNGPMGAFEHEPFAAGTRAVAQAVADSPATTIVGGGDSAAALHHFGLADRVDDLSTGGGATLELIEGRALPGVAVLEEAPVGSAASAAARSA